MHEVLVNRLGGLSLPRKSVVSLHVTDCPDMTLDVYRGRKTTTTIPHMEVLILHGVCMPVGKIALFFAICQKFHEK